MKGNLKAVLALAVLLTTGFEAEAQFRQNRALQLGVKIGASSYTGDIGPAAPGTPAFDATYEFEAFYRFNQWLNVGVKHSTGAYPALGGISDRRHSTALGLRSYFLKGRFSPYVQIGVSRSYGGEKAGMGLSTALGAEMAISNRFALYQDVSFDTVFPDEALDGSIGGRSFDMFGRIGIGIRVSLGKNMGLLRIDTVNYPEAIEAGKPVRLEAVLIDSRDGVAVEWELPGGVIYQTNPVEHTFAAAGHYEFDVVATGQAGRRVTKRVRIDVQPSAESIAAAQVDSTIGIAKIETVYGPRVTVAGTESIYRVRLSDGAEQPVEYLWDMGDGQGIIEGNNIAYRFAQPGTHAIKAWVRNAVGADSVTIAVLIDPAPGEARQEVTIAEASSAVAEQRVGQLPIQAQTQPEQQIEEQPEEQPEKQTAAASTVEKGVDSVKSADIVEKKIAAEASPPSVSKPDVASAISDKIAAAATGRAQEAESTPKQPSGTNPQVAEAANVSPPAEEVREPAREVVLQAAPIPGIDWSLGGFTWVVESATTREAANKLVAGYESLGFPVGVYRDAVQGRVEYHVVVGQSASKRVAERIGSRIQRHVPRRIWLLEIPR